MKAILLMFDTLNRHMLPPYGCDWTVMPNFKRLAERTVVFDNSYACSLPCMPARRDLHTGRPNFFHRSWGPIEAFDDSMPEILTRNGVYTHLATDHYHYWEEGGTNYHTRYNSFECFRGQEGDAWIGQLEDPQIPECVAARSGMWWRQDWVNRQHTPREEDQPQAKTMSAGLEFLKRNHAHDRWFLQIETFDPHEPYFTQQKYKDLYKHEYNGPHFDWPPYAPVGETPDQVQHCRYEYAALLSMCDEYLGKVLDAMDEHDLWKDTMLIVNTDHGFMLGEHDSWGKCWLPFYNEIAHTPFFVWDPRCGLRGGRRGSLVQTIDIPPTLLDFFGVAPTKDMLGKPLAETIRSDAPIREAGLFGIFGGHVNVTDGRYVYMRGSAESNNQPLFNYTLVPNHMRHTFPVAELQDIQLAEPFNFTKGCRTMKIASPAPPLMDAKKKFKTMLFDIQNDPQQQNPITDPEIEGRMTRLLVKLMRQCDAPEEQYRRLGLVEL